MTLQQLRYAVCIADNKSINKAAAELFITQPSLSSTIKDLENEINITIFLRSNRGIVITPEGEEFLGYARQMLEHYKLIEERYTENKNFKKKFSVSMQHYTFAVEAFIRMAREFGLDEYEFAVHETKTAEVIENVKNQKSEIGILYLNDFNRKVIEKIFKESELEFIPLFDCSIYAYISKSNPLAGKESATMKELEDYPCPDWYKKAFLKTYDTSKIKNRNDMEKAIHEYGEMK
mgnify:CR=1 FL=1